MLNSDDIVLALSEFEPGKVPLEVFNQIARLSVIPVVEVILVSNGQVLLLKRRDDDVYWPGQFCTPGKILTASGAESIDTYAQNIVTHLDANIQCKVRFSGLKLYHSNRGAELAIVYVAETVSFTNIDNGYPTNLNDIGSIDIITEHKDMIESFAIPYTVDS